MRWLAGLCLLWALPAFGATADELPMRKPGLWEMKMVRTGGAMPEMTMQHCTDQATDKDMNNSISPAAFAPPTSRVGPPIIPGRHWDPVWGSHTRA